MGVVNVTPDSFSDGGLLGGPLQATAHARRLIDEGADILDVGGESTRPGSRGVALDEERRRVLPVLESLRDCGVPLSVDTQKPELMHEAIAAGASMVNDVNALRAAGSLPAIAGTHAAVCLMHMRGNPQTMQVDPRYDDVVAEVRAFLAERIGTAERSGVTRERIDPALLRSHSSTIWRCCALAISSLGFGSSACRENPCLADLGGTPAARLHKRRCSASPSEGAHASCACDVAATRDALAVLRGIN
jgi:dihydropteroate synthase